MPSWFQSGENDLLSGQQKMLSGFAEGNGLEFNGPKCSNLEFLSLTLLTPLSP
eukprot:Gb_19864 [translate_table: standard]